MSNRTREELNRRYFEALKERFPEIELVKITPSAENSANTWVYITIPEDEDRAIALIEYAAELSSDILLEHDYLVTIFPANRRQTSTV